MAFGIDPSGFIRKTAADIQAELEDAARGIFGASIRLARTSVMGQLVALITGAGTGFWELAEASFWTLDPSRAEGLWLDGIARVRGLARQPTVKSAVDAQAAGVNGTIITAGSIVELTATGARFIVLTEQTISGGAAALELEAEEAGAVEIPAGETWEIVTPITGWSSVANAAAGVMGRAVETDAELRARLAAARGGAGAGTVEAIRARVLDVAGVTSARVIENDGDVADLDGRPPHSLEVLVDGGGDAAVALELWRAKPAGIKLESTAVAPPGRVEETITDSQGLPRLIVFTRPVDVPIWIEMDLTADRTLDALELDAVASALLAYGATLEIGESVVAWRVNAAAAAAGPDVPITDVAARFDVIDPPVNTATLPVGAGERARFDAARILVSQI